AAEAVAAPCRGHELHRSLRTRSARTAQLPELRLDKVHGSEDAPGDLEAPLGFAVVAEQCRRGRGGADLDGPRRKRRREVVELAMRGEDVTAHRAQIASQAGQRSAGEAVVASQEALRTLLVQRVEHDVL